MCQVSLDQNILQCQIALTTHSSHIVNSKIHSSNTFNNLNYLASINKCTKAINLTDDSIVSSDEAEPNKKLSFIKKHIKYKVSELFFSDAIIFVEGVTEETLLHYYLEKHPSLSDHYISVFNINGAHGKLYLPLAKKLSIPSLIVTDLDIKRQKCEKGEKHKNTETCAVCGQQAKDGDQSFVDGSEPVYAQITSLLGRTTTNSTLAEFNHLLRGKPKDKSDQIDNLEFFEDDNLYVVFQKDPIENQYASSLEEALILTNFQNDIVNDAIKKCKSNIYKEILNDGTDEDSKKNLISASYKLQKKLSDSKSKFSNELLFGLLSADKSEDLPKLPNYLNSGLNWLVDTLHENNSSLPDIDNAAMNVQLEDSSAKVTEVGSNVS